MSIGRPIDLYLPATGRELSNFVERAHRIVDRFSPYEESCELEVFRESIVAGSITRAVRFDFSYDEFEGADIFKIEISEKIPVDATWDCTVAKQLLGLEKSINDPDNLHSFDLEDYDGFVEGFIEPMVELVLVESSEGKISSATKSMTINILDDDCYPLDEERVYDAEIEASLRRFAVKGLEELVRFGEVYFDIETAEAHNLKITRADLLMAAQALIEAGIMHPLTKAYRGAPRYCQPARFF